jgi:predicted nucleic acid-binding protein
LIYLDTGCLIKLYYPEPESLRVQSLVSGEPIAVAALHDLELYNALELKIFRKEASATQVRKTRAVLEEDLRHGVLHRPSVSWEDALADAISLSKSHTRAFGCRSLDVLHCALARLLRASAFITTDVRQRRLATKIGLSCPLV